MNKVALFCLGLGLTKKRNYSLTDRFLGFLTLVPPIYLILTPINAASAAVLSIQGYPPWNKAIIGLITVALAGWGVNAFNHYIDYERDKTIWPDRSLPAGRINRETALISAIVAFVSSFLLSWFFFNPQNFFILVVAIILGAAYSAFFRDRVGYLSLPPVPGLIYLGGWAAFSPETLFTTVLPWLLFLLGLIWQAAHITIYYPLHIVDDTGERPATNTPPLFLSHPSSKVAAGIGLCFMVLTFILSMILPMFGRLGYIYIIFVLAAGIYSFIACLYFFRNTLNRKSGYRAFASLSVFRLVISAAILLDVFIH